MFEGELYPFYAEGTLDFTGLVGCADFHPHVPRIWGLSPREEALKCYKYPPKLLRKPPGTFDSWTLRKLRGRKEEKEEKEQKARKRIHLEDSRLIILPDNMSTFTKLDSLQATCTSSTRTSTEYM